MQKSLDRITLDLAMKSLAIRLIENNAEKIEIVGVIIGWCPRPGVISSWATNIPSGSYGRAYFVP